MDKSLGRSLLGHILFWLIIVSTYALSAWGYRDNFQQAIVYEAIYLPARMVAVYFNWFLWMPNKLYRNRVGEYLLGMVVVIFVLATLQRYLMFYWAYPTFFPTWPIQSTGAFVFFRVVQNMVVIATPVALSTGMKLFLDWFDQKNRAQQLEQEKVAAELQYLKSQINPHFLFNTLNNIYGLAIERSVKVPNLLLKLSDLLSYSLYESGGKFVDISRELQLIKDFIALEMERSDNRVRVEWGVKEETLQGAVIAPLLLIPLVENAFKHGTREEIRQAEIAIQLEQQDGQLLFRVRNTIPEEKPANQEESGIGLVNVRRRLAILYPDQHEFSIQEKTDSFEVTLKVDLHEKH
ncbi:MAG: histidine kinase [Saprospiraceae bacterium]|nr:histidine kinase [Saprospiraceae bacterium]